MRLGSRISELNRIDRFTTVGIDGKLRFNGSFISSARAEPPSLATTAPKSEITRSQHLNPFVKIFWPDCFGILAQGCTFNGPGPSSTAVKTAIARIRVMEITPFLVS